MNTKRRAPNEKLEGLLYLWEKWEMWEKREKAFNNRLVSCSHIGFSKWEVWEENWRGYRHRLVFFPLLKIQCGKKINSEAQLKQWLSLSLPTFPTFPLSPEDPPDFISQPTAIHEKVKT